LFSLGVMKVVLGLFLFSLSVGIVVFVHYGLPAYAYSKAHWPSHDPNVWIDFPPWTALLAFAVIALIVSVALFVVPLSIYILIAARSD
jgi:hypothetical protein